MTSIHFEPGLRDADTIYLLYMQMQWMLKPCSYALISFSSNNVAAVVLSLTLNLIFKSLESWNINKLIYISKYVQQVFSSCIFNCIMLHFLPNVCSLNVRERAARRRELNRTERNICVHSNGIYMQFLWLHEKGLRDVGWYLLRGRCRIFVAIITVLWNGTLDKFQSNKVQTTWGSRNKCVTLKLRLELIIQSFSFLDTSTVSFVEVSKFKTQLMTDLHLKCILLLYTTFNVLRHSVTEKKKSNNYCLIDSPYHRRKFNVSKTSLPIRC